jgi:hypothetical protein
VLTDTGEVRVYAGRKPPEVAHDDFQWSAAAVDQLHAVPARFLFSKRLSRSLKIRLGEQQLRIAFDGKEKGDSYLWHLVSLLLDRVGDAIEMISTLFDAAKGTKRRRAREARRFWYALVTE